MPRIYESSNVSRNLSQGTVIFYLFNNMTPTTPVTVSRARALTVARGCERRRWRSRLLLPSPPSPKAGSPTTPYSPPSLLDLRPGSQVIFYSDKYHDTDMMAASRRMLKLAGVKAVQLKPAVPSVLVDFTTIR